MRYQKKPVVIEAEQYTGTNTEEIVAFCPDAETRPDGTLWITTLEGGHVASPGDWIIKGVKGEFYPCKPDIFEMTYEKVGKACIMCGNSVIDGDFDLCPACDVPM